MTGVAVGVIRRCRNEVPGNPASRMFEALAPVIRRSVWLAGALLLMLGPLILAFGIGWTAVEAAPELRSGVARRAARSRATASSVPPPRRSP